MKVEKTHHIEASEPNEDGSYDYHYEFHQIRIAVGEEVLIARSYVEQPEEVVLMCIERNGALEDISWKDLSGPLLTQALAYLRGEEYSSIRWVEPGTLQYADVPGLQDDDG